MASASGSVVRIHPDDNVVVLARTVRAGEQVEVDGRTVTLPSDLTLGHKLAARDIAAGEKILKYGLPIGTAVAAIAAGEHVHVHNLRSDYLPTYTHDAGRQYVRGER
ncbi:MAG: UxaA family hydrolase [Ectothiorhodospiraceae bacterium]|nr:UxaA family hydrolase [Ectothiorhodospiraceae bacterium]